MTNKQKLWIILGAVIVFCIGFYCGLKYQESKTPAVSTTGAGAAGAGGFTRRTGTGAGAAGAGSFTVGQVLSVGNGTATVQLRSGSDQVLVLTPSTQYREAVNTDQSAMAVGSMVTVTGSSNTDGSLTAQSVQIVNSSSTPASTTPAGQ